MMHGVVYKYNNTCMGLVTHNFNSFVVSTQDQPGDTSVVVSDRGDESTILSVNDSMAMGDITADSVKVHMT